MKTTFIINHNTINNNNYTMDIQEYINYIIKKHITKSNLTNIEKQIIDICMVDMLNILFIENKNIDKNNFMVNINNKLIQNDIHIVKLLFSNNQYIYVDKKLLLKIDYFKDMFESCDVNNDIIICVTICDEIDCYDFMNIVMIFLETGKCELKYYDFNEIIKHMEILNFIGGVYFDNRNLLSQITTKIYSIMNNEIKYYASIQKIESLYTILKQNDYVTLSNDVVILLWKHATNKGNSVFTMTFFTDILINKNIGIEYIIDQDYKPYYDKIYGEKYNVTPIVIKLLEKNNIESWNIIIELYNKNNIVSSVIIDNLDLVTEIFFKINFHVLDPLLILKILMKFNKNDVIEVLIQNLNLNLNTKDNKFVKEIFEYIKSHNNNDPNTIKQIQHIQNYVNQYNLVTISNFKPFDFKIWKILGFINEFNKFDDTTIVLSINVTIFPNTIIDLNTPIMYSDLNVVKQIKLKKILMPYIDKDKNPKTIECSNIVGGLQENKQRYLFIIDYMELSKYGNNYLYILF